MRKENDLRDNENFKGRMISYLVTLSSRKMFSWNGRLSEMNLIANEKFYDNIGKLG
jgi:hypothetical protein